MRSKALALCLVALAFVATNAFAVGEGRLNGRVLDAATGAPIPDATILITNATAAKNFKQTVKTNKKGEWAFFALDATMPYNFTVDAAGYDQHKEQYKVPVGTTTKKDFTLAKAGSTASAGTAQAANDPGDPAIDAYNAGAALANSGDFKGAVVKFNEALAAKPDLTAAQIALAKVSIKAKDFPTAIAAANKVLEIDSEDTDMWAVLAAAYDATGDKAKAAEAKAKLPKNASALFNDAAKVINAGNDAEGEKLLKQAISIDEKMAVAYYELGMIYVRSGKSAEAKTNLQKYLELEPNGKDAPTAKEMLSYLK